MNSNNKNQDKTYKRGLDTFEMHVDGMPSKKQKKQKVKMRQNGKKEIEKEESEWSKSWTKLLEDEGWED